jgi:plasmid stability protein
VAVHPKTTETNVRLPSCVFDAPTAVMARHGTSRDATVRRLLAEHVERQEQTDSDALAWSAQCRGGYVNDQRQETVLVAVTARSDRSAADQIP